MFTVVTLFLTSLPLLYVWFVYTSLSRASASVIQNNKNIIGTNVKKKYGLTVNIVCYNLSPYKNKQLCQQHEQRKTKIYINTL